MTHVHGTSEVAAPQQASKAGVPLIFVFGLAPFLFDFVWSCDAVWNMLRAGGRVKAYAKLPSEAALRSNPTLRSLEKWPSAASVEFANVSLRYRPGLPRILRGVSLTVDGGSSLAIIGSKGAGKRSVFAALTRLVECATGAISVDALDISTVGLHDLRSVIASLAPDPVFFAGSIRSNLDATRSSTDDEVWAAIKKVELGRAILSLDEVVIEKASNYSDGERQLLSIARAILRRPKVVLIEESEARPSAAEVDWIDRCLQQEFQNSTRLVITHRSATALAMDKVLVMVNGQIVEHGAPGDLQKNTRSLFRSVLEEWKRRDRLAESKKP